MSSKSLDSVSEVGNPLLIIAATAASGFGLLADVSTMMAQSAVSKSKPSKDKTYEAAKDMLPSNLYTSYRLLERIMSANASITQKAAIGVRSIDEAGCKKMLGDSPVCSLAAELPDVQKEDSFMVWALQVAGAASAAPNAYATSFNNRIILNKALDEAFAEDLEAKACVIAHEMAHLQQDHSKRRQEAIAGWNAQAAGKISAAVKNAHRAQQSDGFWNGLAMIANAASAGLNTSAGNYSAAASAELNNQRLAARVQADQAAGRTMFGTMLEVAQRLSPEVFASLQSMKGLSASYITRTMKDVDVYLDEVATKSFDLSRQHEIEADELAVGYLARAGLNPEGCLRVIEKLHRGSYRPVAGKHDTHPGEEERKQKLRTAIDANSATYNRIKSQLVKPAPLAYDYDSKFELVTVYPRNSPQAGKGSNPAATVDQLLGK
jgi:Zn-dependent protease with chaperone function